mgnify:FL=1
MVTFLLYFQLQEENIEINIVDIISKFIVKKEEDNFLLQEESQVVSVDNDSRLPYTVFIDRDPVRFETYHEAVDYASKNNTNVYYWDTNTVVWENDFKLPLKILLDAPLISQLPELPRGCEVTSLAMMLNYAGVTADKMILAEEVIKDPTPYQKTDGKVFFGNPYDGFVGDMYNINNPGYGVYHGPIKKLAENYLPNRVLDLTGTDFQNILYHISMGKPVWVISNATFSKLPNSAFQTWETPTGTVEITYREHSVLITGFDKEYIYFNDPLEYVKNRKILKENFVEAWKQMGKQAITFID